MDFARPCAGRLGGGKTISALLGRTARISLGRPRFNWAAFCSPPPAAAAAHLAAKVPIGAARPARRLPKRPAGQRPPRPWASRGRLRARRPAATAAPRAREARLCAEWPASKRGSCRLGLQIARPSGGAKGGRDERLEAPDRQRIGRLSGRLAALSAGDWRASSAKSKRAAGVARRPPVARGNPLGQKNNRGRKSAPGRELEAAARAVGAREFTRRLGQTRAVARVAPSRGGRGICPARSLSPAQMGAQQANGAGPTSSFDPVQCQGLRALFPH